MLPRVQREAPVDAGNADSAWGVVQTGAPIMLRGRAALARQLHAQQGVSKEGWCSGWEHAAQLDA